MALWSCPSCPESALLGLHPSPNHFLPPYCMNTHIIQLSNCGNIECIKRERTTYTRDSGSNRGDTIFPLKSLDSEPMDVSHFYSKPSHLLFFFFFYAVSSSLCLCSPAHSWEPWVKMKMAGFPVTVILGFRLSATHCTKRLGVKT